MPKADKPKQVAAAIANLRDHRDADGPCECSMCERDMAIVAANPAIAAAIALVLKD